MKHHVYLLLIVALNIHSTTCMLTTIPSKAITKTKKIRRLYSIESVREKLVRDLNGQKAELALPKIYKTVLNGAVSSQVSLGLLANQAARRDITLQEKDNFFILLKFAQRYHSYKEHKNPFFNEISTIVHEAIKLKNSDLLKKLALYSRHNIDLPDNDGNRPLYLASSYFCGDSVEILLKHGANPNSINELDKTPLIAILDRPFDCYEQELNDLPDLIQLLMRHGAIPTITDKNGHSAIQYVQSIVDVIEALRKRDDHYAFLKHRAVFTVILRMLKKEKLCNCTVE